MEHRWTAYYCTVRVTQGDFCSHADKLIYKEHSAFEHLFKNQNCSVYLCCNYCHYRSKVGRESRPRHVIDFWNCVSKVIIYLELLGIWNCKLVSINAPAYTKFCKTVFERAHFFRANAFNCNFTFCCSGHTYI